MGDHPADEVLDEGLRHSRVDGVVAHLIADAVGRPAECQLGEVGGADDEPAVLVREAEQKVGARARLHVLERHVVYRLAVGVGVVDGSQQLGRHRPDVDRRGRRADRLGEGDRVRLRVLARREAGHRVGEDVAARASHPVHRAGDDEQSVCRVEAARHADDGLRRPDRAHALLEPRYLDAERLVAVLVEARRVVGHEREAVERAAERRDGCRGIHFERDDAGEFGRRVLHPVVIERALAQAILPQSVEVDVGDRRARTVGKALGLGEERARLVDHRLTVPRHVVGRLAEPRRSVDVGGVAAERLRLREQVPVVGAGDRDGAAGEVQQHRRSGERGGRRRRDRHPHVFADLGVHDEAGHVGCLEEQVGADRHLLPAEDRGRGGVGAARVPARFVELAVGGQVGLRGDAEHGTPVDDDGAVVEARAEEERRPDDEERSQRARRGGDIGDRGAGRVEHDVLHDEVVDRVAGEAEFGKDGDGGALVMRLAGRGDDSGGVPRRIGDRDGDRAGRDAREAVPVDALER